MSKSKVYFSCLRTGFGVSLPQKLQKLIRAAGIGELPLQDNYAAVKIHFGEPGNLAFLRPAYAAAVVDVLKEYGAKPFLTDCNTLYVGGRKNALDHLESAYKNGFTPYSVGCQILIADGLKGTDEVDLPVCFGEDGCKMIHALFFLFIQHASFDHGSGIDRIGASLIQCHGVGRSKHPDIGNDRHIIFGMAIAIGRNINHEGNVELGFSGKDRRRIFRHFPVAHSHCLPPHGSDGIFRTDTDTATASNAFFRIDRRLFIFDHGGIVSAYLNTASATDTKSGIDFRDTVAVHHFFSGA